MKNRTSIVTLAESLSKSRVQKKDFDYKKYLTEGWLGEEAVESSPADQWWSSLDPQYKKEVCEEICGYEAVRDAIADWYGYVGSQHLSASEVVEVFDEIWNELAPDEKEFYMNEEGQAGTNSDLHEEVGEEGAKGRFMDAISNVQDFGENYDQDFETDINGHHILIQYDWGAWDRPEYNTIKIDGKGLSYYKNDDPMFDELAAELERLS